jgi:hypothetical protein
MRRSAHAKVDTNNRTEGERGKRWRPAGGGVRGGASGALIRLRALSTSATTLTGGKPLWNCARDTYCAATAAAPLTNTDSLSDSTSFSFSLAEAGAEAEAEGVGGCLESSGAAAGEAGVAVARGDVTLSAAADSGEAGDAAAEAEAAVAVGRAFRKLSSRTRGAGAGGRSNDEALGCAALCEEAVVAAGAGAGAAEAEAEAEAAADSTGRRLSHTNRSLA